MQQLLPLAYPAFKSQSNIWLHAASEAAQEQEKEVVGELQDVLADVRHLESVSMKHTLS
jgi:hypothetical protein